jgi:hypothetical protein
MLMDLDHERARLFGADGTALADGPVSLGFPVIYVGQLRFARNDRGDVVLASGDPARPEIRFEGNVPTTRDRMRCSNANTRRCFVSWLPDKEDGGVRHGLVVGKRVKRGFDIPVRERDMTLAADGRHALIHTDNEIIGLDTRRGKRTVYYRERDCRVDETELSPDASTIYFVLDCGMRSEIKSMPAKEDGKVRTLVSLEAEVSGLEVLGQDDLVYSTIDYESRLVVLEGLPLP